MKIVGHLEVIKVSEHSTSFLIRKGLIPPFV